MSYNGLKISICLKGWGNYNTTSTIVDVHSTEETKGLVSSDFKNIKTIADQLSCIEILLKYSKWLGLNSLNI